MTHHAPDHVGTLAGLIAWAEQRERLAQDRADLVAAAWRGGTRNVAELSRITRVSRDTIYADLKARGISPAQRSGPTAAQNGRGANGDGSLNVVSPHSVRMLAKLVSAVASPASPSTDELVRVIYRTSALLDLVADLLDPPVDQGTGWTAADLIPHLALQAYEVARAANGAMAARTTAHDIAAYARWLRTGAEYSGRQLTADCSDVTLRAPDGTTVTVTVTIDETGLTTLHGDGSAISGPTTVLDQVELVHALSVLARVADRHLDPSKHIPRRMDAVPGMPAVRQRLHPSNEDRV